MELCSNNSCSVNYHPSSPSYIYLKASIIVLEFDLCCWSHNISGKDLDPETGEDEEGEEELAKGTVF